MEKQATPERCARWSSITFAALSAILLLPVPVLALALDGTVTLIQNDLGWADPTVSGGNLITITPQSGSAGSSGAVFEYRFGFTGAPGTADLIFSGFSGLNISQGSAVITYQVLNNGGNLGGVIFTTGQFAGTPPDNLIGAGTTTPTSVPNNNYVLDVTFKFSKDSVWTWTPSSSTTHAFATLQ